jgi:5'-deoxynucleotidase YfbR-like HD superfamily hydrolase
MPSTDANDDYSSQPAASPVADTAPQAGVSKELWLLLSLFLIALLSNFLMDAQRMVLAFYTLPTLFSAYKYGRRHAVMTALASTLLVVLVIYFHPVPHRRVLVVAHEKWFDIALWGGTLVVIAYAMGTLYDRMQGGLRALRESYRGILLILQHIVANDKYSQNHSYRVAICATKIAERMDLGSERVEDIRAAALLHDVEQLGISRDILYKSANFTAEEFHRFQREMARGKTSRPPVGGSLRRVIPILLAYAESSEGKAIPYQDAPLESRILAVADAYESLTSGSGGAAPSAAIGSIVERSGQDFDPEVVDAFVSAFQYGRSQMVGARA